MLHCTCQGWNIWLRLSVRPDFQNEVTTDCCRCAPRNFYRRSGFLSGAIIFRPVFFDAIQYFYEIGITFVTSLVGSCILALLIQEGGENGTY